MSSGSSRSRVEEPWTAQMCISFVRWWCSCAPQRRASGGRAVQRCDGGRAGKRYEPLTPDDIAKALEAKPVEPEGEGVTLAQGFAEVALSEAVATAGGSALRQAEQALESRAGTDPNPPQPYRLLQTLHLQWLGRGRFRAHHPC